MINLKQVRRFALRQFVGKPVEACMMWRDRLDPRSHDAARRIVSVTRGALPGDTGHWLIFVYNHVGTLPCFLGCLLEAARHNLVSIAVVTNRQLDPIVKEELISRSSLFIERKNIGRDMGAYKDALSLLPQNVTGHIILANDSVYYDPRYVDDLIRKTLSISGFSAVTESVYGVHHGQSYFMGFGPTVHKSQDFRAFWESYVPLSVRKHAVRKGELGLSKALRAAGVPVRPLWDPTQLKQALLHLNAQELLDCLYLLPDSKRRQTQRRLLKEARVSELGVQGQDANSLKPLLVNVVASVVAESNQVSTGGLLYAHTLQLPVIKRNIYYTEAYTLHEIESALKLIAHPCADEIMTDLRVRGRLRDEPDWRKRLLAGAGVL